MGIVRRVSVLSALPLVTLSISGPALFAGAAAASPAEVVGGSALASHGVIANTAAGVPAAPKLNASSWIVADATTGQVLGAKDPHGQYLPASTLKTLTSITLIPRLKADMEVRPTQAACDVEGTKVGMTPKMTYRVQDLFHALLLMSANDAAVTLAQAFGGYKKTIAAINAEARRLHADDTLAASPNGLDVDLGLTLKTQHSSSYDLALFLKQGLTLPAFRKYVGTVNANFPSEPTAAEKKKGKKIGSIPIYSHDRLLPSEPYQYAGMIGGKNGYTVHSQQTFVGAAQRNGHTIIIALMHAPALWTNATKLLDWGFAVDGKVQPVGTLVDPGDSKKSEAAAKSAPAAAKSSSTNWPMTAGAVAGAAILSAGLYVGLSSLRRRDERTAGVAPAMAAPSGPGPDYDPPRRNPYATPPGPRQSRPYADEPRRDPFAPRPQPEDPGDAQPWFGRNE